MLLTPFAAVGAGMIGAGVGSLAGGYISEEKLGGSYELGAFVGNLVGGVAGSAAYSKIVNTFDAAKTANTVRNTKANVDSRKFSDYIFKDGATHGKDIVFRNLGYGPEDADMLTKIYKTQGASKYDSGNYTLGKLDNYGQRIDIGIELFGKGNVAGKTSYIKSGWMILSENSIKLNTPFSGFYK